jgi:hypothetical protein
VENRGCFASGDGGIESEDPDLVGTSKRELHVFSSR